MSILLESIYGLFLHESLHGSRNWYGSWCGNVGWYCDILNETRHLLDYHPTKLPKDLMGVTACLHCFEVDERPVPYGHVLAGCEECVPEPTKGLIRDTTEFATQRFKHYLLGVYNEHYTYREREWALASAIHKKLYDFTLRVGYVVPPNFNALSTRRLEIKGGRYEKEIPLGW